jgi:N-carbamoyl-L-amino-acid hydrolase
MLTFAHTALAARAAAASNDGVATFGRLEVEPNGTNAIPSRISAWLDARAARPADLDAIVEEIATAARHRAIDDAIESAVHAESVTPRVDFSRPVADFLHHQLGAIPELDTGAGHDAGILSAKAPTGMLFVRNPSGVSHAPNEFAAPDDCAAGVAALAEVMAAWVST